MGMTSGVDIAGGLQDLALLKVSQPKKYDTCVYLFVDKSKCSMSALCLVLLVTHEPELLLCFVCNTALQVATHRGAKLLLAWGK